MLKKKQGLIVRKKVTSLSTKAKAVKFNEKMLDDFLGMLSAEKILELSEKCQEKILEKGGSNKKEPRLTKIQFLNKLKAVFSPGSDYYNSLFFMIFNRFKINKCEVKPYGHKTDVYYINDIIQEEVVIIFEILCAFTIFLKTDIKEKLKTLFILSDSDSDGYIHQKELKRLVYTIHCVFANEIAPFNTNSSVMNQSLASIKAGQSYSLILNYPGGLGEIFSEEKYVTFDQFYEAILKIPDYKFNLFPFYVNFKKSIYVIKREPDLEIKRNILNDFTKNASEMISAVKSGNDIGKTYTDFKKSLQPIQKDVDNHRKMFTKKSLLGDYNGNYNVIRRPYSNYSVNMDMKLRDFSYEINFNKITGLEAYPGKLKIIEQEKEKNKQEGNTTNTSTYNTMNTTTMTEKTLFLNKNLFKPSSSQLKEKKTTYGSTSYMTYNEVMEEIQMLINKNKTDEIGNEELIKLSKKINKLAFKYKLKLKIPTPNVPLVFGKFKYKKYYAKK